MKGLLVSLVLIVAVFSEAQPIDETERLAGFARLYGVVRYFHPSDAAQEINWDQFVLLGVQEVRLAKTSTDYKQALHKLFDPLTVGMQLEQERTEIQSEQDPVPASKKLVAWQHFGAGVHAPSGNGYVSQRTNRKMKAIEVKGNAAIVTTIDPKSLRGLTVRLVALARAETTNDQSGAAIVLRVDRESGMGFFDNMKDRLIREPKWREYSIEGPVAEDAQSILIGVKTVGGGVTAGFDNVRLYSRTKEGKWELFPLTNGGFETRNGWEPFGESIRMAEVDFPQDEAPEGKSWIRIAVPQEFSQEPIPSAQPARLERTDVTLLSNLFASVPVVLDDESARITPQQSDALIELKGEMERTSGIKDKVLSVADVVIVWAVLRHFYPYWDVVRVNWDERLPSFIKWALGENETLEAHSIVIKKLLAEIQDGHAHMYEPKQREAWIPLDLSLVEGQIIITASKSKKVRAGDLIVAINGQLSAEWLLEKRALISGSDAWKDARIPDFLRRGPENMSVRLTVENDDGSRRDVQLEYNQKPILAESPYGTVTELKPGIWYVDLRKAALEELETKIVHLSQARGVIFDVRGYPTGAVSEFLPHLLDSAEQDRWMHVPHYFSPGGKAVAWSDLGWDLQPKLPKISPNRVFLTDGRAISFAESIMGYIKDRKLATIIGSNTAGANGDVVQFQLPSGIRFYFTGMRVTRHDGTTVFHGSGIEPDQIVKPTINGIRKGRDEQLESAIEYLQNR